MLITSIEAQNKNTTGRAAISYARHRPVNTAEQQCRRLLGWRHAIWARYLACTRDKKYIWLGIFSSRSILSVNSVPPRQSGSLMAGGLASN
jgi:hypothetical protein